MPIFATWSNMMLQTVYLPGKIATFVLAGLAATYQGTVGFNASAHFSAQLSFDSKMQSRLGLSLDTRCPPGTRILKGI